MTNLLSPIQRGVHSSWTIIRTTSSTRARRRTHGTGCGVVGVFFEVRITTDRGRFRAWMATGQSLNLSLSAVKLTRLECLFADAGGTYVSLRTQCMFDVVEFKPMFAQGVNKAPDLRDQLRNNESLYRRENIRIFTFRFYSL